MFENGSLIERGASVISMTLFWLGIFVLAALFLVFLMKLKLREDVISLSFLSFVASAVAKYLGM